MSYKKCPRCEGYGWVEGINFLPTPNGPAEILTRDECEVCNGEGRVSKEESNNE